MKKRFSAFFLALALCLGLAVPAFAADAASDVLDIKIAVPGGNLSQATVSHQVKRVESNSAGAYVYSAETIVLQDSAIFLPLDSSITIGNMRINRSGSGLPMRDLIIIYAFSDPDNDGIYEQRVFRTRKSDHGSNEYSVVPLTEKGPFASTNDVTYTNYQSSLILLGNTPEVGSDTYSETLISDQLYDLFGPNTLLLISVEDSKDNYATLMTFGVVLTGKPAPIIPSFTDLLPWCETEAKWAAEQEITNGYGGKTTFAPNVDCTQAQILTFLWRAEDKPQAAKAPITTAASYQDAINWAYEKNMIDSSFDPDAPCTRSQAVSYIWQALGKPDATEAASFSDVAADAPYAGAVNWAVEKKVTNGYGGNDTFAPDQVCKRGQIACFLYRAYNN